MRKAVCKGGQRMLSQLNQIIDEVSSKTPEERMAELAHNTGLDTEEIKLQNTATEWANNCLIVELNIGRARFERALTPPDLGLQDEELEEYVNSIYPGRQVLVTGEHKKLYNRLNSLDRKARRVVEKYSIKTEFGYAVSCIPNDEGITPYEKMVDELNQIELQYRSTHDLIIQNLDDIRKNTERIMYESSIQIWQKMQKDDSLPPEEFKLDFAKKAMRNFPASDHLETMYMFRIRPKFIPLAQTKNELDSLEHNALNLKAEIVESIRNGYEEQVEGFITDVLVHLRQIIHETISQALNSLRKAGSLPGPTLTSLRKMIENVRELNFADDRDVVAQTERLERAIGTTEERDAEEIGLILEQLEIENRQFLMALGHKPRATRELEESEKEELEPIVRKTRRLGNEEVKKETPIQVRKRRVM